MKNIIFSRRNLDFKIMDLQLFLQILTFGRRWLHILKIRILEVEVTTDSARLVGIRFIDSEPEGTSRIGVAGLNYLFLFINIMRTLIDA